VNAKLNEEDDSSNVLLWSNLHLKHDLEETKEKDENEESPAKSEDDPGNEITILQQLKYFLRIQRDITVRITSKMMMEGAVKARKRGINLNLAPVIILDFAGQEVFYSTHQSFLTHQGIYILVINGSLNLDSEIPLESFIPGRHCKPTTRGRLLY
jgi:predicted DNA binding CopG/RHH family protein